MKIKSQRIKIPHAILLMAFSISFLPHFSTDVFAYTAVTRDDANIEDVFHNESATEFLETQSFSFQDDWKKITLEQNLYREMNSSADGKIQMQADLKKTLIDWDLLSSLNAQAENVWHEFLVCGKNDELAARQIYIRSEGCEKAQKARAQLRIELDSVTTSGPLMPISFKKMLACHNDASLCKHYHNEEWLKLRTSINYGGEYDTSNPAKALGNDLFISQLKMPAFHPLLVQMLLEITAIGMPLPHGTYQPSIFYFGSKTITPLHYGILSDALYNATEKKHLDSQVLMELVTTGTLTGENAKYLSAPYLKQLRQALAAFKILQVLILGNRHCGEFGLFPRASGELLGTMLASGISHISYFVFERGEEMSMNSLPLQLRRKMDSVCKSLPAWKISSWENLMWRGVGPATRDVELGWSLLAKAGAWRKLSEN